MFASNIHRIQQVVDLCVQYHRRICFIGRSMVNNMKVAMTLGELKIPVGCYIEADDLDDFPDNEIVVLTTGSQGEPMSGLTRMAYSEHRKLQIRSTDLVILSASPIPGNEVLVSRVINQLYRCGAQVVYKAIADVHVSGHACQEELKLIHTLVHPKVFIPVHGEFRMLCQHAKLAKSMGMDPDNIIIPELGQIIELGGNGVHIAGAVPDGRDHGGRTWHRRRGKRSASRPQALGAGRAHHRCHRRQPGKRGSSLPVRRSSPEASCTFAKTRS